MLSSTQVIIAQYFPYSLKCFNKSTEVNSAIVPVLITGLPKNRRDPTTVIFYILYACKGVTLTVILGNL